MSRRLLPAHVAVTTEGDVLLNVAILDCEPTLEAVVKEARRQQGAVFVGVALRKREIDFLLDETAMILPNVTAPMAGKRIWRRRRRQKVKSRR